MKALEKDPANRYQTVRELAEALLPFGPRSAWSTPPRVSFVSLSGINVREAPTLKADAISSASAAEVAETERPPAPHVPRRWGPVAALLGVAALATVGFVATRPGAVSRMNRLPAPLPHENRYCAARRADHPGYAGRPAHDAADRTDAARPAHTPRREAQASSAQSCAGRARASRDHSPATHGKPTAPLMPHQRRFTRSICLLLLALTVAGIPRTARADDEPSSAGSLEHERAEKLKSEGDDAMQRLAYDQALELYNKSFQIEPSPALYYNRGRALQALARFPEALEQFEAFERDAPVELKARVPKLGELIAGVKRRVSTLTVHCNVNGARVSVRRRGQGKTPLDPLRLNAGSAIVEVTADGYHSFSKTVTLPGGGALELDAKLYSKKTTGVLQVSSPVAGAIVLVDGRRVGSVPAQVMLRAGNHEVVVRKEGYDDAETQAVIDVGRTNRLDVPLDQPPAITERWWFWTGVGVVVVGGAVLTAALLTEGPADSGDIPPGQVSGPLLRF